MPIAWSWSRIETFEQCPRKFELQNIKKPDNFKFETNDAVERGKKVHDALEKALLGQAELPEDLKHVAPIIAKIQASFPEVQTEREIAWDKDKKLSSWFDTKVTMFRCALDVLAVDGTKAIIYDWKTGNVREKPDQLRLYAAVVFMMYPDVQTVQTAFIFVDHMVVKDAIYHRDQFQKIWSEFEDRAELIQIANDGGNWPPRKNGLCNWCKATKDQCTYGKR